MKYALVTGGSRGIGRAISVKLASMGYHIIVNYVSNEAQAVETIKLIEEAGSTGEILKFDVSNLDETVAAITGWQAAHKHGDPDLLDLKGADEDPYLCAQSCPTLQPHEL